jgi:hypothetical protein
MRLAESMTLSEESFDDTAARQTAKETPATQSARAAATKNTKPAAKQSANFAAKQTVKHAAKSCCEIPAENKRGRASDN